MGYGMAGRYLDAGFTVAVWNRSKAKAEDLIARGARWAASPADAADGAEAVVTMVADDAASRDVWLGKDGAAANMKIGHARDRMLHRVVPARARSCARTARPRSCLYRQPRHRPARCGRRRKADAAGRRWMPTDLEMARPYLAPLGTTIRHFGAVGTGTVYKLINNLMGAIQIAGIAEGLAIAEQAGLDMKLVLEAVETGVAASPQVIRHSKRMAARILPARRSRQRCGRRMRPTPSRLAESLLSASPDHGPRRGRSRMIARKAYAPDDDEGKMIEIISRAEIASSSACSGIGWKSHARRNKSASNADMSRNDRQ